MPTSTAMSPKCSIDIATCMSTCSLLLLPIVYCGHLYIYLYSLLWLPAVYYGYLQSAMVTCCLLWLPVVYCGYLQSTMATCSLLWVPVVYYGYLQSTMGTCSLLWLPVVYYDYLQSTMATCSLLWLPAVCYGYLQSTMGTCSLLWLPVVYCGYLLPAMATCSLLWVPVVYYGYLWSTKAIPIASLQCCLVFCTQLLYYAYLVFIITASMLRSLHCLLSLPMLLSGLLTHSCIPCLVYMTIQSAMPKQSSELPIAFYARLVNFSNFRSILSNRMHITEFEV